MDEMVLKTQKWLNETYNGISGYSNIAEDGQTGRGTMTALVTALQIELGISSPNGNFGPATTSAFQTLSYGSPKTNQIYILEGGLYCKGYNTNGFDGQFGNGVTAAVKSLQTNAGLTATGTVNALLMKAILSMDSFTLLDYGDYNGDSNIRTIQQNLNKSYSSNQYFAADIGLVPCDGIYASSTNKALIYALQIEEGLTGVNGATAPNGVFGPKTKAKCPTIPTVTTNPKYVYLLQYALYCNGFAPNGFDGSFNSGTQTAVTNFQNFCALTTDGVAGSKTWASLLVSTGDTSRIGTACDCSDTLTVAKANTLVNNGYKYVGRYLTGSNAMTASELKVIYSAGLSVFLIFEYGNKLPYFTKEQGTADAKAAYTAAYNLGFKLGSLIYFAVDFDATNDNVTNAILPYFTSIQEAFNLLGNPYKIGIYGPRNVCKRVAKENISLSSFVGDMSPDFSGNLGYSLPEDWAFDQISTITLGSGDGQIEIDNSIFSSKSYTPSISQSN